MVQECANFRKENAKLAASVEQAAGLAEAFKEQLKDAKKFAEALELRLEEKDALLHELKDMNSQAARTMYGLLRDHQRIVSDMCTGHAGVQVSSFAPSLIVQSVLIRSTKAYRTHGGASRPGSPC